MEALKTCRKCGVQHPDIPQFFYRNGPRNDRGGKRYLRPYCKPCDIKASVDRREREKLEDREGLRIKEQRISYMKKYGLTIEARDAMLAKQGGMCVLCYRTLVTFNYDEAHVDHCHKTGKVRGVLCHICNKGLGFFKEDVALMQRAIDYLNEAKYGVTNHLR